MAIDLSSIENEWAYKWQLANMQAAPPEPGLTWFVARDFLYEYYREAAYNARAKQTSQPHFEGILLINFPAVKSQVHHHTKSVVVRTETAAGRGGGTYQREIWGNIPATAGVISGVRLLRDGAPVFGI